MVSVIISLFAFSIIAYYLVCHIIKLWTGYEDSKVVETLHNLITGKTTYSFENDSGFADDVWNNVKNIIGDKRFEQLYRLAQTAISAPLLYFGFEGGLPFIAVSVYCNDENEKQVLQTVLTNLVKKYINVYGYDKRVLVNWKNRCDLNMPYLEIRYARNSEERRILDIGLQNDRKNIIDSNTDIIDDEDSEDLLGE